MGSKSNRSRRYTEEFKRDAVALVRSGQPQAGGAGHARARYHRGHPAQAPESDPSGEAGRAAADLLGCGFTAPEPGTRLAGDITFIATVEGWLYLATWLDLATREIVGYSMADHHRASLVVDALAMAVGRGRLQPGCIAHSDRGSEYTSEELRGEMRRLGLRQSMGRTGSCFDHAAVEPFFAVLKEEIGTRRWPDRATARAEVFAFIETFYNRRRLRKHPHWGYLTPLEIRQRHEQGHALAA